MYEYPAAAVGESEWGSCNFHALPRRIRCFLQSAADYWLRTFHADGLRMDAVSRLIYWQGDPARGVNGSTLEFLKNMNQGCSSATHRHADCRGLHNFEKVTAPVEYGGLGFDYKWDLGWMNDTLDYFKKHRRTQIQPGQADFLDDVFLAGALHPAVPALDAQSALSAGRWHAVQSTSRHVPQRYYKNTPLRPQRFELTLPLSELLRARVTREIALRSYIWPTKYSTLRGI